MPDVCVCVCVYEEERFFHALRCAGMFNEISSSVFEQTRSRFQVGGFLSRLPPLRLPSHPSVLLWNSPPKVTRWLLNCTFHKSKINTGCESWGNTHQLTHFLSRSRKQNLIVESKTACWNQLK